LALAAYEPDLEKLQVLVAEINRILSEKERAERLRPGAPRNAGILCVPGRVK
jgi:predicted Mrr-cat superfamily restriction endonuclease